MAWAAGQRTAQPGPAWRYQSWTDRACPFPGKQSDLNGPSVILSSGDWQASGARSLLYTRPLNITHTLRQACAPTIPLHTQAHAYVSKTSLRQKDVDIHFRRTSSLPLSQTVVKGQTVEIAESLQYLGSYVDNRLNFDPSIEAICKN